MEAISFELSAFSNQLSAISSGALNGFTESREGEAPAEPCEIHDFPFPDGSAGASPSQDHATLISDACVAGC
jgi:hypothetical protein